jgi:glycerophosphoryl diester phosphodiesterase
VPAVVCAGSAIDPAPPAMALLTSRVQPGAVYLAGAPLLIAHRGGAALAPENTIEAFERAVNWWRADILEVDVQPTRDGEAVVFHDSTLQRTTDGAGPVASRTIDELRQLDAGFRFRAPDGSSTSFRGAGIGIPTFAQVLDAFPDVRVNVEIKDERAQERVLETILAARASHRVLVAAGKKKRRSRFRDYAGAISASGEEMRAFYAAFRLRSLFLCRPEYAALQMPERYAGARVLTPELVRAAHAMNIAVHVWTVDAEADMRRLLRWGVDGIVTDRPDRLATVLHEMYGRPLPPGPPTGSPAPADAPHAGQVLE